MTLSGVHVPGQYAYRQRIVAVWAWLVREPLTRRDGINHSRAMANQAEVRWNLMVDLGVLALNGELPLRSGWTTPPRRAGRWNASCCSRKTMDAGGLWCMDWIPGKQSRPKARGTCWLRSNSAWWSCCLASPAGCFSCVEPGDTIGCDALGHPRPLNNPLPQELQWCPTSAVGFCGDWIAGPGFGRAEGAISSGVNLAEQLHADR